MGCLHYVSVQTVESYVCLAVRKPSVKSFGVLSENFLWKFEPEQLSGFLSPELFFVVDGLAIQVLVGAVNSVCLHL